MSEAEPMFRIFKGVYKDRVDPSNPPSLLVLRRHPDLARMFPVPCDLCQAPLRPVEDASNERCVIVRTHKCLECGTPGFKLWKERA